MTALSGRQLDTQRIDNGSALELVVPNMSFTRAAFGANNYTIRGVGNQVIAATSAALGVFTPAPCVPVLTPWTPGAAGVTINDVTALDDASECRCAWLGVVTVTDPGQARVTTE